MTGYKGKVTQLGEIPKKDNDIVEEFQFCEMISIPCEKPDIDKVLEIDTQASVNYKELIIPDSVKDKYELSIGLKIRQKIDYVSVKTKNKIENINFEKSVTNILIPVPKILKNEHIGDLIKCDKLKIIPIVENSFGEKRTARTIFKNTTVLIQLQYAKE